MEENLEMLYKLGRLSGLLRGKNIFQNEELAFAESTLDELSQWVIASTKDPHYDLEVE